MTRRIEIGCGLALAALLLIAPRAAAGTYTVAQCGWGAGGEASWRGSGHFRGANECGGGVLRGLTRADGRTAARGDSTAWRWTAPPGTSIAAVRGWWWRSLRDRFEQRLNAFDDGGGGQLLRASGQSRGAEAFSVGAPGGGWRMFESALECRRSGGNGRCAQKPVSWAAAGRLVLTLNDPAAPRVAAAGTLAGGGWVRGAQALDYRASDAGSGVAVMETALDGDLRRRTAQPCQTVNADGAVRGARLQPCEATRGGAESLATAALADGVHTLAVCAEDFAGNRGCDGPRQVRVDNTPPGPPRGLGVVGGDSWRAANGFSLRWRNPDQGAGSPLAAAWYRVRSAAGDYDSGPLQAAGLEGLDGVNVPAAGEYKLSLWLGDAAGNAAEASAEAVTLRFDDVAPLLAFADQQDPAKPEQIVATVADANSGVAGGEILYRHLGDDDWTALATVLRQDPDGQRLVARFPSDDVPPGTYELRVQGLDRAGNHGGSELRADGSRMYVETPLKTETVLRARISAPGGGDGRVAEAPYGQGATVLGSLRTLGGEAVAGADVVVRSLPDAGSLAGPSVVTARTDSAGRFQAELPAGPSRGVELAYGGSDTLTPAHSATLRLLSTAQITLRASSSRLRNGRYMTLAGAAGMLGAASPAAGKLVEIEFLDRGRGAWQPIALIRAGAGGAFAFRHRFAHVNRTARIAFRATLPAENGWPYEPAVSAPVTVTVRR